MKCIVTVGISASGKSTWAEDFCKQANRGGDLNGGVWIIVCRDDIRRKILMERHKREILPGELWKLWKFKDENLVNEVYAAAMKDAAENNTNVICCDTNLTEKHRNNLVETATKLGFVVEIKEFPISIEDAWRRDSGRADGVGHSVIAKQMVQWNEYIMHARVDTEPTKDPYIPRRLAIMVDIDGTLAHNKSGRGWFDYEKVSQDTPDPVVRMIVQMYKKNDYAIVIMSGREGSDVCRAVTVEWLRFNNIPADYIFMRKEGDFRDDSIVKEELYWEFVHDEFVVECVIDDRPKVCRKWRAMGIKTLQVGDPHIEF